MAVGRHTGTKKAGWIEHDRETTMGMHAMGWHWLGSLAIVLFWVLIIALALAPIKYLRTQLKSPELQPASEQVERGS
jgi:hypothetical protein